MQDVIEKTNRTELQKDKSEMRNIENSCAMLEEDKATKDRQNR